MNSNGYSQKTRASRRKSGRNWLKTSTILHMPEGVCCSSLIGLSKLSGGVRIVTLKSFKVFLTKRLRLYLQNSWNRRAWMQQFHRGGDARSSTDWAAIRVRLRRS